MSAQTPAPSLARRPAKATADALRDRPEWRQFLRQTALLAIATARRHHELYGGLNWEKLCPDNIPPEHERAENDIPPGSWKPGAATANPKRSR